MKEPMPQQAPPTQMPVTLTPEQATLFGRLLAREQDQARAHAQMFGSLAPKTSVPRKVRWTDEENEFFNSHIEKILRAKEGNSPERFRITSCFPCFQGEFGQATADSNQFVPKYCVEEFHWKNGSKPKGLNDEKVFRSARVISGSKLVDAEEFLATHVEED